MYSKGSFKFLYSASQNVSHLPFSKRLRDRFCFRIFLSLYSPFVLRLFHFTDFLLTNSSISCKFPLSSDEVRNSSVSSVDASFLHPFEMFLSQTAHTKKLFEKSYDLVNEIICQRGEFHLDRNTSIKLEDVDNLSLNNKTINTVNYQVQQKTCEIALGTNKSENESDMTNHHNHREVSSKEEKCNEIRSLLEGLSSCRKFSCLNMTYFSEFSNTSEMERRKISSYNEELERKLNHLSKTLDRPIIELQKATIELLTFILPSFYFFERLLNSIKVIPDIDSKEGYELKTFLGLSYVLQEILHDELKASKVEKLEKIFDILCESLDSSELDSISSLYSKSSQTYYNDLLLLSSDQRSEYVNGIFRAFDQIKDYPPLFSQRRVNHLIVDFDSTCTEKDTTHLLLEIAQFYNAEKKEPLAKIWKSLEESYMRDFSRIIEEHLPKEKSTEIDKSWNEKKEDSMYALRNFLIALTENEDIAVQRTNQSKVLKGIPQFINNDKEGGIGFYLLHESIKGTGKWELQQNCANVLRRVVSNSKPKISSNQKGIGSKLTVLSINWSKELIQTILLDGGVSNEDYTLLSNDLEYEKYVSGTSEIQLTEEWKSAHSTEPLQPTVKTTGNLIINVGSAVGKENEMLRIIGDNESEDHYQGDQQDTITVYIGDSITDILAMYRADIGILIGSSESFTKVANHFGIHILPLCWARIDSSKAMLMSEAGSNESKLAVTRSRKPFTIYQATSWDEINVLLYGDSILETENP